MRGTIVKGISGFYYVREESSNQVFQCKARGVFRKEGMVPHVGDRVEFSMETGQDGTITEIFPRNNVFIRPPLANVDCFIIVCAAAKPTPNLMILDQFILMAEKERTEIILCFNKIDVGKEEKITELKSIYENLYPTYFVSGKTGEGMMQLKQTLKGKQTALAGPSGVGKSTLLNFILENEMMETGKISVKTERGKHTTRHAELFALPEGGMIFDTPGFTSFDILEVEEDLLEQLFPEMLPYLGKCHYDNCRHKHEPNCAVRRAVEEEKISEKRYQSYLYFLENIQNKRKY